METMADSLLCLSWKLTAGGGGNGVKILSEHPPINLTATSSSPSKERYMENGNIAAASPEEGQRRPAFGWAARDASGVLSPFTFSRRKNGENDVTIKILYCGICHSDLHSVKNGWQNSVYPIVPGHEIVGVVTEVGGKVGRFKLGDHAGVGCMVNSCRSCHECARHQENYCPGMIVTCNATDADGTVTYGGYSDSIVVEEHFAVKFPAGMPLDRSAPLLCAGITVYSPMKRFGLDVPGKHIRVVGLGGLGHVAVKFGKAFGAKVTVISTSPSKRKEVVERLGADAFLVSKDPDEMKAAWGTMDGIINTVSAAHDVTPWLFLLKTSGQIIMVGAPLNPLEIYAFPLLLGGKSIVGSIIGGMKETQEMIDFAGLVAE